LFDQFGWMLAALMIGAQLEITILATRIVGR